MRWRILLVHHLTCINTLDRREHRFQVSSAVSLMGACHGVLPETERHFLFKRGYDISMLLTDFMRSASRQHVGRHAKCECSDGFTTSRHRHVLRTATPVPAKGRGRSRGRCSAVLCAEPAETWTWQRDACGDGGHIVIAQTLRSTEQTARMHDVH